MPVHTSVLCKQTQAWWKLHHKNRAAAWLTQYAGRSRWGQEAYSPSHLYDIIKKIDSALWV